MTHACVYCLGGQYLQCNQVKGKVPCHRKRSVWSFTSSVITAINGSTLRLGTNFEQKKDCLQRLHDAPCTTSCYHRWVLVNPSTLAAASYCLPKLVWQSPILTSATAG